jgi:hypothetical protein
VTAVELTGEQKTAWDSAQALWGVHMHSALMRPDAHEPSFAWFSFPPSISVDPIFAAKIGVDHEWESIFAHELGHHVLSPSTRIGSLKITHQMSRALSASSTQPVAQIAELSAYLSNLWSDMLINVRVAEMQRRRNPDAMPGMIRMWAILSGEPTRDRSWWVMMRAYEELWSLPPGRLASVNPPPGPNADPPATALISPAPDDDSEGDSAAQLLAEFEGMVTTNPEVDAGLIADTVRLFGADPIRGALRFGMVLAPYLIVEQAPRRGGKPGKSESMGGGHSQECGGDIDGRPATTEELGEILRDARLREVPRHPLETVEPAPTTAVGQRADPDPTSLAGGQGYGLAETLTLYAASDEAAVLRTWYLSEAARWVRPYREPAPGATSTGVLPGPLDVWSLDDELSALDWPATLAVAPEPIPGITTRQRTSFDDETLVGSRGVKLDLYIDSSGSMPSPRSQSPAILAGAILLLSVLRGGGQVRVTSFSGAGEVAGRTRFGRNREAAMALLTTFYGGGTVFPLDLLAGRYPAKAHDPGSRSHLVVLSDDGLSSMFGEGQPQYASTAHDARAQLDTATLIVLDPTQRMASVAAQNGYDVAYLDSIADAPAVCARLAVEIAHFGQKVRRG